MFRIVADVVRSIHINDDRTILSQNSQVFLQCTNDENFSFTIVYNAIRNDCASNITKQTNNITCSKNITCKEKKYM
jgi:hypothetical protein